MNHKKYPRVMLPALALCLFAAAAMLVSPAASGQKGSRVAEEISQVLESFETMALDPAEVLRSARAGGAVTLRTARGDFDLAVEPYDVRTDNYRAVAASGNGVMTELARTPSHSWRGHVRGQEGTVVRLYLDGQQLQGVIITSAGTFFVEPARALSSAAGAKEFVFYEASDVKPTEGECVEVTLGGKVAAEAAKAAPSASVTSATPPADDAFAPMTEATVATEADFEFFQLNGSSTANTNNDILNVMTQVDGIYEAQLGVSLRVTFQRVWTTNTDPYTLTAASDALDEFASSYDDSFAPGAPPARDLTHMFTGKDFDSTTIGIAYRGVVCNIPDGAYGISQSRFSVNASLSTRASLTAHEIGHNFSATHPDQESTVPPSCSPSIMNSSIQSQAQPTFCQFSRDQITSHITAYGDTPVGGVACLDRLTTPGCSYDITPTSGSFPTSGGTGTVNVASNCNWGVAEGASWVTFASEAGSGNGSVGYTVAPNTGNDGPRRAFVDIGGRQFAITQQGSPTCLAKATGIGMGQTLSGSLASGDCTSGQPTRETAFADVYTFVARAGQAVRIELSTTGNTASTAIDTYLYLLAPDGSVIGENDDIVLGQNTNSRLPNTANTFLSLPQTGVYTIVATSFDSGDVGNYNLKLSDNSAASSVSFSASAYVVNESPGSPIGSDGAGFRTITVTRTGDKSGTATVDYATSDVTATRLKDYEQTLGTLVFAPNEDTKTFNVFVTDDRFAEGVETLSLTLSNPAGTTLGGTNTATLSINSDDAVSGPSPVRLSSFDTNFFVRQQYLDFLNREPDPSGFNFWTGVINECNLDVQCKEVRRINVSAAFFLSIEFQNTGYLVYRTYKAAYGDTTSPNVPGTVPVIRLNEFLPDTQRISQNVVVGADGWEAQLNANKAAYALEFVLRARFLAEYPLTLTSAQFVDKLVQRAGITLTTAERDALIAQLSSTADVAASRAAVLRAVAENQQLQDNEKRRAYVLMQYYGYLRRDPDTGPNTDFTGWKFWLDKLNDFNGDAVAAEMVKAFLDSDEYVDRFGTRP